MKKWRYRDQTLPDYSHLTKAIIYCRVSGKTQEMRGDGLGSQEACCREYARYRGYEVEEVFRETLSGGTRNRPVTKAVLAYLRRHRKEGRVVIIDSLNRFSREGPLGYWPLREELRKAGGMLESPSMQFGDDPSSVFTENVLSSVAQLQREQNAEQTVDRMRGRLLNGYWSFPVCIGYRYERKPGEGKVLVRDEPLASIIQEGMEGYASGRFQSQAEVKRFFEAHLEFPKDRHGAVANQRVTDILTRVLYAGYIEAPDWDVPLREGRHEGLISFGTFERIQQRLKGAAYAPARADINADFPLRGAVACAHCGKPLTACWSTSQTGVKHPYYMCFGKGCPRYRKSIQREKIEGQFVALLERLTPAQTLVGMAYAMFKDVWGQRSAQAVAIAKACERGVAKIAKHIGTLLDRIVNASSETVVGAYEEKIAELERGKLALTEKQLSAGQRRGTFEELFELAMRFLSSPSKIWNSGTLEHKKLVLRLTFAGHLAYCPESGFRTPKTSLPFKVLEGIRIGSNADGAPGTIRTSDPQIRSLVLYPAELRARAGPGSSPGPGRA